MSLTSATDLLLAQSGNIHALFRIYRGMENDPSLYSPSVLAVALSTLDPEPPSPFPPLMGVDVFRAPAFHALRIISRFCSPPTSAYHALGAVDALVAAIIPRIDRIMLWVTVLCDSIPERPGGVLHLIRNLLALQRPDLTGQVVTYPGLHNSLLRVWPTGLREAVPVSDDALQRWMTNIEVTIAVLKQREGRDAFLHRFYLNGTRCSRAVSHIAHICIESSLSGAVLQAGRPGSLVSVASNLASIARMIVLLLEETWQARPILESGYLSRITRAATAVLACLAQNSPHMHQEAREAVYFDIVDLVRDVSQVAPWVHALRNWRDLVTAGYGSLLFLLAHPPFFAPSPSPLTQVATQRIECALREMAIHVPHAPVGQASVEQQFCHWSLTPPVQPGSPATPELERMWRNFGNFVESFDPENLQFPTSRNTVPCDSYGCSNPWPSPASQRCSGCSSVAYCSSACQTRDWLDLHRDECKYARGQLEERRRHGGRTSWRDRRTHLRLAQMLLGVALDKGSWTALQSSYLHVPPRLALQDISEVWNGRDDTSDVHAHEWPRRYQLFKSMFMSDLTTEGDPRLVNMLFRVGHHGIYLTAHFRRSSPSAPHYIHRALLSTRCQLLAFSLIYLDNPGKGHHFATPSDSPSCDNATPTQSPPAAMQKVIRIERNTPTIVGIAKTSSRYQTRGAPVMHLGFQPLPRYVAVLQIRSSPLETFPCLSGSWIVTGEEG
ncbi:hypothetical protein DFP72DRAFT_856679 [Ephemerocybe angulata]|uniref:MYND-type domain-containing protein n=1 Tax=Ephemerocybe angulata TaxID=980116 RepID=A0A8H6LYJ2_9AGAR|nr:hypothetical protein DFP72DRAFT_856679 [Tulosesus angulatus]